MRCNTIADSEKSVKTALFAGVYPCLGMPMNAGDTDTNLANANQNRNLSNRLFDNASFVSMLWMRAENFERKCWIGPELDLLFKEIPCFVMLNTRVNA
jgi:hypothetical protein